MKPLNFGISCIFNIWMQASAAMTTLKNCKSEIRKHPGYENYEYKKNDASVYKMLTTIGNEDLAKRYAERLRSFFEGDEDYKEHKPCTTVDLLVSELESPEKLL